MKIIKLFFLITFGLYAKFKLDIPNNEYTNTTSMKKIVKEGWCDSNESLNFFIIKYGKKVISQAQQKINKPLVRVQPSKKDKFPTPKLLLGTDDYLFVLSYVKYLEYKGETEKALCIYIEILKGLNNTEDKSMLNVILQASIQEITILGLNDALYKNVFSESMKISLKSEIKDLLVLDTNAFFIALEGEKEFVIKAYKASGEDNEDTTKEYDKLMLEVEHHMKEYVDLYFGKMYTAMKQKTPEALKEFEVYMEKEREDFSRVKNRTLFFLYYAKAKVRNFLMLGNENYGLMSKFMGQAIALTAIPTVEKTYLKYLESIRKNKKILNSL